MQEFLNTDLDHATPCDDCRQTFPASEAAYCPRCMSVLDALCDDCFKQAYDGLCSDCTDAAERRRSRVRLCLTKG